MLLAVRFIATGTAVVTRQGLRSARRGLPWLSSRDIVSYEGDGGPFVDLVDDAGIPSGTALHDPSGPAPIRLLSSASTRDPVALLHTRLERALARRASDRNTRDALRLCHSDADGVPGLMVDRFGPGLLVAIDAPAMAAVLDELLPWLERSTGASTVVVARPDGVEVRRGASSKVGYVHGRLALTIDLASPAARGVTAELERQRHIRRWARGRCLDLAAGPCGYGLQLGDGGASEVFFVDDTPHLSASVVEDAKHNRIPASIQRVEHEPVDWLHRGGDDGRRFDTVVFHPRPTADETSVAVARAATHAQSCLKFLDEGGILAMSCPSEGVVDDVLASALQDAAMLTRKRLQVLERLGPGPDHPSLAGAGSPSSLLVMRVLKTA